MRGAGGGTFYAVCAGFCAGVLARSLVLLDPRTALAFGLGAAWSALWCAGTAKKKRGLAAAVFILAAAAGVLRYQAADRPPPAVFEAQVGHTISWSGIVTEEPVMKENGIELVVRVADGNARAKVLLTAKSGGYEYGDTVAFTGTLARPAAFTTDQIKTFDYPSYLKKDGVRYLVRRAKVAVAVRGGGNRIIRALMTLRRRGAVNLRAVMPTPQSLVMRALILGDRASFSERLRQAFVTTGLIHIVTISGYHVSLVAAWTMRTLGFLPAAPAAAAGMVAVFLYVMMTGAAPSAVRAGIMASLALLGRIGGRQYDAGRALAATGAAMVAANPFILAFDISFQLSFIATVAVVFLAPKFEPHFGWIGWKWLRDITAITCAAYLFVTPFILYKMGSVSLVAIPANLAVLPLIPATMLSGLAAGVAGFVSHPLALAFGRVATLLLSYELSMIAILSRIPLAAIVVPDFPLSITLLAYALFLYYLFVDAGPRPLALPVTATLLTLAAATLFAFRHQEANRIDASRLEALLAGENGEGPGPRTRSNACAARGPLPDPDCTPGAVFPHATLEKICVKGYTATVRNVSTKLRKQVYAAYGVPYPQPPGLYEVDHLIPLAIGGSNDIANLWTEPAEPAPGFHEKDLVEVYLQGKVCAGRAALGAAQRQIAEDWLAVYQHISPEELLALKKKYRTVRQNSPGD